METKRTKVIMLPTNKPPKQGNIMFWKGDNSGIRPKYLGINKANDGFNFYFYLKPQHLYFINDDEIKEGDWYYTDMLISKEFCIKQFKDENLYKNVSNTKKFKENNKKIIATTDKSLITKKTIIGEDKIGYLYNSINLPQPSKAFIEKYCELSGIDEVLVEYEIDNFGEHNYKLKVDSHNTITIHPIKDSWNKEEIEILLNKYRVIYANKSLEYKYLEQFIKDNL